MSISNSELHSQSVLIIQRLFLFLFSDCSIFALLSLADQYRHMSCLNNGDKVSQVKPSVKENQTDYISYYYFLPQLEIFKFLMKGKQIGSFSDILKEVKNLALITEVVLISENLQNSPLQSRHCSYGRKIIFNTAQSQNLAASKDNPADHPASNTNIYSCHCRPCYLKCF